MDKPTMKKAGAFDLCSFTVCDSKPNKKKEGEPVKFTETYYACQAWDKEAKIANGLMKGDKVMLEAVYSTKDTEKDGKKTRWHTFNVKSIALMESSHVPPPPTPPKKEEEPTPEPPEPEEDPQLPF